MTELRFVQVDAFADRPVHRQSGGGDAARRLAARRDAPGDRDGEQSQRDRLHVPATTARRITNCAGSRRRSRSRSAATPRSPAAMSLIGERDRVRFRTRQAGIARGGARRRRLCDVACPPDRAEPKPLAERRRRARLRRRVETLWHPRPLCPDRARVRGGGAARSRPISARWRRRATSSPSSPRPARAPTSSAASSPPAPASTRIRSPARPMRCSSPYWAERLGARPLHRLPGEPRAAAISTGRLDGDRVVLGGKLRHRDRRRDDDLSPKSSSRVVGHSPGRTMTSILFTPLEVGGLRLRNRIVIAPMCQYSADGAGNATDWHFDPSRPPRFVGRGAADHRGDRGDRGGPHLARRSRPLVRRQ